MGERSRRDTKPKLDKFAEYKRAREGGKRVFKVFRGQLDGLLPDTHIGRRHGHIRESD